MVIFMDAGCTVWQMHVCLTLATTLPAEVQRQNDLDQYALSQRPAHRLLDGKSVARAGIKGAEISCGFDSRSMITS